MCPVSSLSESDEFVRFALDHNVVGFKSEPITLKSGRKSHWYANWRRVVTNAADLDNLVHRVIEYAEEQELSFDLFYGVPEGATILGVVTQYTWVHDHLLTLDDPVIMGRGKPKEHGDPRDRYFIGNPGGKSVVVLEDVTTTGQSLIDTIGKLEEAGANVVAAISLVNRMEWTPILGIDSPEVAEQFREVFERVTGKRYYPMGVQEAVGETGIGYHALCNAVDILPAAYNRIKPGRDIGLAIEEEFRKVGVDDIELVTK